MFILLNLCRAALIHPNFHLPPLGLVVAVVVASAQHALHGHASALQSAHLLGGLAGGTQRDGLRILVAGADNTERRAGDDQFGDDGEAAVGGPALPDSGQSAAQADLI
jgi:hypothetical protein